MKQRLALRLLHARFSELDLLKMAVVVARLRQGALERSVVHLHFVIHSRNEEMREMLQNML